jgi:hypothetical protein
MSNTLHNYDVASLEAYRYLLHLARCDKYYSGEATQDNCEAHLAL